MPPQGLFEGHTWRISPEPFALEPKFVKQLEKLGRVLLQFYRALNLLYRKSHEQAAPEWVADWLDAGKPKSLIQRGLGKTFKQSLPKVIRPDILLTEDGFVISELDSIPGGIGLTAWLNQTYSNLNVSDENKVIGGSDGMLEGFSGIFDQGTDVQIVVSEESKTYRPEMEWLASNINDRKIQVRDDQFKGFQKG